MDKRKYFHVLMLASFMLASGSLTAQSDPYFIEAAMDDEEEANSNFHDLPAGASVTVEERKKRPGKQSSWTDVLPLEQVLAAAETSTEISGRLKSLDVENLNGKLIYTALFSDSTMIMIDTGNNDILYCGKTETQEFSEKDGENI